MTGNKDTLFNHTPRRKAEFIKPLNLLKAKVGYGGLSEEILNKAERLLEKNAIDFQPLGEIYLQSLLKGIEAARKPPPDTDDESLIAGMLYPAMQLKANGGMFRYPLVTRIGDKLIQFLEVIAKPDPDNLEIVLAFHTTMRAVLLGKVMGNAGKYGDELMQALENACVRYMEKSPENRSGVQENYSTEF